MLSLRSWLSSKPPDPVLVFVLNLFGAGGLGYWILGQKAKAAIAVVLFVALAWPTCFSGSPLRRGRARVAAAGRVSIFVFTSCARTGPIPQPGAVSVILILTSVIPSSSGASSQR